MTTLEELKAKAEQNVKTLEEAHQIITEVIWSGDSNMTETEKQQYLWAAAAEPSIKQLIIAYKKANDEAFK